MLMSVEYCYIIFNKVNIFFCESQSTNSLPVPGCGTPVGTDPEVPPEAPPPAPEAPPPAPAAPAAAAVATIAAVATTVSMMLAVKIK
jgi:hypothetical protein